MSTTIKIVYGGDTVILTVDLANASAPLLVDSVEIGRQTADARHRTDLAVALAARAVWPEAEWPAVPATGSIPDDWEEGCEAWDDLEYAPMAVDEIEAAEAECSAELDEMAELISHYPYAAVERRYAICVAADWIDSGDS